MRSYSIAGEGLGVGAVGQTGRDRGELGKTSDPSVLLVLVKLT